jgi:hypothetical protein
MLSGSPHRTPASCFQTVSRNSSNALIPLCDISPAYRCVECHAGGPCEGVGGVQDRSSCSSCRLRGNCPAIWPFGPPACTTSFFYGVLRCCVTYGQQPPRHRRPLRAAPGERLTPAISCGVRRRSVSLLLRPVPTPERDSAGPRVAHGVARVGRPSDDRSERGWAHSKRFGYLLDGED